MRMVPPQFYLRIARFSTVHADARVSLMPPTFTREQVRPALARALGIQPATAGAAALAVALDLRARAALGVCDGSEARWVALTLPATPAPLRVRSAKLQHLDVFHEPRCGNLFGRLRGKLRAALTPTATGPRRVSRRARAR
jgi:hypothetical protein